MPTTLSDPVCSRGPPADRLAGLFADRLADLLPACVPACYPTGMPSGALTGLLPDRLADLFARMLVDEDPCARRNPRPQRQHHQDQATVVLT